MISEDSLPATSFMVFCSTRKHPSKVEIDGLRINPINTHAEPLLKRRARDPPIHK
jgi:hypothetical protein